MDDFIAIDVETANKYIRGSICQISVVGFLNGELQCLYNSLINPNCEFSPELTSIHGITPEMVEDAPSFSEALSCFQSYLSDYPVVAHNASFDIGAIKAALQFCEAKPFDINYACTLQISRVIYYHQFRSYSLDNLCNELNIPLENHHDAFADAFACANLLLKIAKDINANSVLEVLMRSGSRFKNSSDYPLIKSKLPQESQLVLADFASKELDTFAGKTFVITGEFSSFMNRKEVEEIIVSRGGKIGSSVTLGTDVLVIGYQDLNKTKGNKKSSKHKKAEELIAKGVGITLMGEDDFLRSIGEK